MRCAADQPVGRRAFVVGAAATAVTGALSCTEGEADRPSTAASSPGSPTSRLAGDPFSMGVASGDPLPGGVVLWTRLAPTPLAGGLAGMPDTALDVRWQVAADDRFTAVVTDGVAVAEPDAAHSVHVDVTGLEPSTTYWYRFEAGGWTSPVGRTRTAPDAGSSPPHLRVAVVACQDFGGGHYAAYRHLLDDRADVVVHLGDYIYEWPSSTPHRPVLPDGVPGTLEEYRLRHASYRSDPDLQAAHARYPFVVMWDDHDVFNNHTATATPAAQMPVPEVLARRAAAYRAYWEHLPLRVAPPTGPDVVLYRDLGFGDLVRLHLLDTRQYAEAPPCRNGLGDDFGDCADRGNERALLGAAQEAWLDASLAGSDARWNLVASSTLLAGMDFGPPGQPGYQLETWDGYPTAQRRLVDRLGRGDAANPVVLSADWHTGLVADVHRTPHDPASPVVCAELMTPPISSPIYRVAREQNPHLRHVVPGNGYTILDVEPDRLTATFHVLDDVTRPDAARIADSTWDFTAGTPTPIRRL